MKYLVAQCWTATIFEQLLVLQNAAWQRHAYTTVMIFRIVFNMFGIVVENWKTHYAAVEEKTIEQVTEDYTSDRVCENPLEVMTLPNGVTIK